MIGWFLQNINNAFYFIYLFIYVMPHVHTKAKIGNVQTVKFVNFTSIIIWLCGFTGAFSNFPIENTTVKITRKFPYP